MKNESEKAELEYETNQTRTEGMILRSSDFDHLDRENPFVRMASNPAALHRCAEKVKGRKEVDNPWAVCNASLNRKGE